MKKIIAIIIILFNLNSCASLKTNGIVFYNYSHEKDLWINVSAKIKGQESFKNLTGFNCSRYYNDDIRCGSDLDDFSKWDKFLIEYSNIERTEIYKSEIVSKRKLFGKWKGKIKYGKANWKAYLADEDLKKYPEWNK